MFEPSPPVTPQHANKAADPLPNAAAGGAPSSLLSSADAAGTPSQNSSRSTSAADLSASVAAVPNPAASAAAVASFDAGDKVIVNKAPGSMGKDKMAGEIFAQNKDGTYMVKLSDGRVYNRVAIDRLSRSEEVASFRVGERVIVKKAPGSMGKDKMTGEIFAINKDGTFMIKLSDARVYNRVTLDRITRDPSQPNSRQASSSSSAFLTPAALQELEAKAAAEAKRKAEKEFRLGERVLVLQPGAAPESQNWFEARVVAAMPGGDVVDVHFLADGVELKEVSVGRVKKITLPPPTTNTAAPASQ